MAEAAAEPKAVSAEPTEVLQDQSGQPEPNNPTELSPEHGGKPESIKPISDSRIEGYVGLLNSYYLGFGLYDFSDFFTRCQSIYYSPQSGRARSKCC